MDRISTANYNRNIIINYIFKLFAIVFTIYGTRLNIIYLGKEDYGIWTTILSIISWMNLCDFGIGNGLRNELSVAIGSENYDRGYKLIAKSIKILSKIAMGLLILGNVAMVILVKVRFLPQKMLLPVVIITSVFCLNFIFGVVRSISYAYQESGYVQQSQCLNAFLSVVGVLLLNEFTTANAVLFAINYSIAAILSNLYLLFILLVKIKIDVKEIVINFTNGKEDIGNAVICEGMYFFLLQICAVVLYSTDNVIVKICFGESMVTDYSVIHGLYDTGYNLFSIILAGLWSGVTYAITRQDVKWVRKQIKNMLLLLIPFAMGVILVGFLNNFIMSIWIGENAVEYDDFTIFIFGLYCVVFAYNGIFSYVANGLRRIKNQLVVGITQAIVNIPLSFYLAVNCGMGMVGVKVATLICVVAASIYLTYDVYHILGQYDKNVRKI